MTKLYTVHGSIFHKTDRRRSERKKGGSSVNIVVCVNLHAMNSGSPSPARPRLAVAPLAFRPLTYFVAPAGCPTYTPPSSPPVAPLSPYKPLVQPPRGTLFLSHTTNSAFPRAMTILRCRTPRHLTPPNPIQLSQTKKKRETDRRQSRNGGRGRN